MPTIRFQIWFCEREGLYLPWQSRELEMDIYICFIDHTKVFDCVQHNNAMKVFWLRRLDRNLRVLGNLFWNKEAMMNRQVVCRLMEKSDKDLVSSTSLSVRM